MNRKLLEAKCKDAVLELLYTHTYDGSLMTIIFGKLTNNKKINKFIIGNNEIFNHNDDKNDIGNEIKRIYPNASIEFIVKIINYLYDDNLIKQKGKYLNNAGEYSHSYNISPYGKIHIEKKSSFEYKLKDNVYKFISTFLKVILIIWTSLLSICSIYFPIRYDKRKVNNLDKKFIMLEEKINLVNNKLDSFIIYYNKNLKISVEQNSPKIKTK